MDKIYKTFEEVDGEKKPEKLLEEYLALIEDRLKTMPEQVNMQGRIYTRENIRLIVGAALRIVPRPDEEIATNPFVKEIPIPNIKNWVIEVLRLRRMTNPK